MQIRNYLNNDWSCKEKILSMPPTTSVCKFFGISNSTSLNLGLYSYSRNNTLHMTVYCQFWMINNTGLLLSYKVKSFLLSNIERIILKYITQFTLPKIFRKRMGTLLTTIPTIHQSQFFSLLNRCPFLKRRRFPFEWLIANGLIDFH